MIYPPNSFVAVAETLIKDAEVRVAMGERSSSFVRNHKDRLEGYCRDFFKKTLVRDIDHRKLLELQAELVKRGLSGASIRCVMSFVSQVLKLAVREGMVRQIPAVPRPAQKDAPRPGLSRTEYRQLLKVLKQLEKAKEPVEFKGHKLDRQVRDGVTLMVNAFLRPGDLFKMKHHHIDVVDETGKDARRFLRLNLPASKGHSMPTVSMKAGVPIYQRVWAFQREKGFGKPDDYVFLPEIKNRSYAKEVFSRLFMQVLTTAGLKHTTDGQPRSLYSLRHYAITARLIHADGLDVVTLAKNARTSPEMISRFYAHWLHPEQNLDIIQSFRRESRYA